MALAISIATHCGGYIALHAQAAFKAGTTHHQVAETVGVAAEMCFAVTLAPAPAPVKTHEKFTQTELSLEIVG